MCFSSWAWTLTAVLFIYEGQHTLQNIFTSSLSYICISPEAFSPGRDPLWMAQPGQKEGSHYAHPYHPCRTRGACSAHLLHKWSPHKWMQQACPTLTCLQHGQHTPAPSENMTVLGPQILARLQSCAQPPCLQPEPLLLLPWLGGSSQAFCLISWLTTMELACFQALWQPTATEGWKVRYWLWLRCCC